MVNPSVATVSSSIFCYGVSIAFFCSLNFTPEDNASVPADISSTASLNQTMRAEAATTDSEAVPHPTAGGSWPSPISGGGRTAFTSTLHTADRGPSPIQPRDDSFNLNFSRELCQSVSRLEAFILE
jgi:hypothetical protein